MILTDTKINNQGYCHIRLVYDIVCLPMSIPEYERAQGGVFLVIQDQTKGWSVESTLFHGPNVASCEVVTITNGKLTPIIGAYLPPSILDQLLDFEEALIRFWDHYPIVLDELSANIGQSQNPRSQQLTDLLIEFGTMELFFHFQQR